MSPVPLHRPSCSNAPAQPIDRGLLANRAQGPNTATATMRPVITYITDIAASFRNVQRKARYPANDAGYRALIRFERWMPVSRR